MKELKTSDRVRLVLQGFGCTHQMIAAKLGVTKSKAKRLLRQGEKMSLAEMCQLFHMMEISPNQFQL